MINDETYTVYRNVVERADEWIDKQRDKNGLASYQAENAPQYVRDATNDIRSDVQVYEFNRDKPARFTAYIGAGIITTFVGAELGTIITNKLYRDGYGNLRHSIRVRAVWGGIYKGTSQGAGMYAHLWRIK